MNNKANRKKSICNDLKTGLNNADKDKGEFQIGTFTSIISSPITHKNEIDS